MAIELAGGSSGTMEGSDGSTQQTAVGAGDTYEQLTEETPGEGTPGAGAAESTSAEAQETASQVDEFRTMTDEEIAALPPELQQEARALRKRYQAAYTKKTQNLADLRRKAEVVDRFQSDPAFRQQVLQRAQEMGITRSATKAEDGKPPSVPPALIEARKRTLPPEMHWLAENLALGDFQILSALHKQYIEPLATQLSSASEERRDMEYRQAEESFAGGHPGWESAEDDMVEVLEYLKSPALSHPRFGNKLELLYSLATRDKSATKAVQSAIERTAQAAKNKSVTTASSGRGTTSNLEERIRKAPTDNEAWDLVKAEHRGR